MADTTVYHCLDIREACGQLVVLFYIDYVLYSCFI